MIQINFGFFEEASPEEALPFAIEVPVLKVFDGDGFRTKIALCQLTGNPKDYSEREAIIRCAFIDAPELEQRGGSEARQFLAALIGGRKVWLDIRMKIETGKIVDAYGRIVAVPYLGNRNALEVARRNKRGIWAYEDNVHPWTFKRQKYIDRRASAKKSKTVEKCPAEGCVGSLVKRNGKFGAFFGCSNYPNCRYTRSNIEMFRPR